MFEKLLNLVSFQTRILSDYYFNLSPYLVRLVLIELLANKPTQTESLLQSRAGGIGLHVNAGKTEYMCFNQKGDISLNGRLTETS